MRIAFFAKSTLAHGMGGMETHVDNLCHELAARGHMVEVVTTRHPSGVPVEEKPGLRVRYLTDAPPRRYSRVWWRASRMAFDELLGEGPLDLVLSQSLSAASVARAAPRPPVYPFLYGLVLSHFRSEWHQGSGLHSTLRFLTIKLPEIAYYASVYERPFLRRVEAILATYDQLAPTLEKRCPHVFVSYNGVDAQRFAPHHEYRNQVRRQLRIGEDEIVILLAGVMTRQKGMQLGIEAFGRLAGRFPALRLLVVGSGPDEESLHALGAGSPHGARLNFVGGIPHHEMPRYFNAADIFVHPSLRVEGLPTVIAEAMASSLPVVATDTGGTKTAIVDGRTGILVPKGNIERLTAAIETLVTDSSLAARLAAAGRERAQKRFAWPEIVDRLLADLASVGSSR